MEKIMGPIWIQRIMKAQQKYQQVMKGRYARLDPLNRLFLVLGLFFFVVRYWLPFSLGYLLFFVFIALTIARFSSKKIYVRSNENQAYLQKTVAIKSWFTKMKNKMKRQPEQQASAAYTIFSCPTCQLKQRAPKGKGEIRVTCKKCGTQFTTKV